MIKRTGEVILGIIGILGYGLASLIALLVIFVQTDEQAFRDLLASEPSIEVTGSIDQMIADLNSVSGGLWLAIIILAVICGIIAMIVLKGNKKPKLAGILFLSSAVISTIVTGGAALFGAVFFLIAGIMSLVRKPQQPIEQ
ncbi:DUF4064 domain-containing protein [Alkalihalobacillus trypoxylicola]|uniref:DUF4064 domain-containing protein n=1 Tax=Alkalihalobacillus trypoxylicola TaxID=519424 RepID=A0A161QCC6_9BACI|nr:DUF4064 domain-containing protein [Alkalihalobacillus trypoxylicola]KYG25612.1 hypothetical protein AZF04_14085 [Alkalihalobacillus trypoxylicola]